MSIQFIVKKVALLIEPATVIGHDGQPYKTEGFDNRLCAWDLEDNLYVIREEYRDTIGQPDCWHHKPRGASVGGKKVYRDYWKHESHNPDSPYGKSIREGEFRVLYEFLQD